MPQPRRLHSRFPLRARIRCQVKDTERQFEALTRDISVGGLFIVHDPSSVPPGSELEIQLPTGDGQLVVAARVVRVLSGAAVVEPGMGVQFERVSEDQSRALAALVQEAQRHDDRCRIPKPAGRMEDGCAPNDPIHDYLLKFMDGTNPPELIAERSGLDVDSVVETIHEMLQLDIIELVPAAHAYDGSRPNVATADAAALDRLSSRSSVKGESFRPISIDAGVSSLIEATAAALGEQNDYELLGVTAAATAEEVRAAFLERYQRFQAHASEGVRMSRYGRKLEAVLKHLADANATLSSPVARAEYDQYLAGCALLEASDSGKHAVAADERAALWEQRARYEEKRRHTERAADSWVRVYEVRPNDLESVQKAASLILEAKLGVRRAQSLAERAVNLAPNNSYNHRLLARVYLESGLRLRARKELQTAADLERHGAVRSPAPPKPNRDGDAGPEAD